MKCYRLTGLSPESEVREGLFIHHGKKHFPEDSVGVNECRRLGVLDAPLGGRANAVKSGISGSIKSSVISCARSQQARL